MNTHTNVHLYCNIYQSIELGIACHFIKHNIMSDKESALHLYHRITILWPLHLTIHKYT